MEEADDDDLLVVTHASETGSYDKGISGPGIAAGVSVFPGDVIFLDNSDGNTPYGGSQSYGLEMDDRNGDGNIERVTAGVIDQVYDRVFHAGGYCGACQSNSAGSVESESILIEEMSFGIDLDKGDTYLLNETNGNEIIGDIHHTASAREVLDANGFDAELRKHWDNLMNCEEYSEAFDVAQRYEMPDLRLEAVDKVLEEGKETDIPKRYWKKQGFEQTPGPETGQQHLKANLHRRIV